MKRIFPILLGGVAAAVGVATAIVITHPGAQMEAMTDYVMKNLRDYNWSALQMEDPVTPALTEALGEERTGSVEAFYHFLKDSTSQITWKTVSLDPEKLTAQVEVTYPDGGGFLTQYSEGLSDYIVASLDAGTMELSEAGNVMTTIPEETNCALIEDAVAAAQGTNTLTTTVTVYFAKSFGLCIPQTTSDEVYDAASAGLVSRLEEMPLMVAERLIPQVVDRTFRSIQSFDEAELSKLTGSSMSELLGLEEDSPFYKPFVAYLRGCAAKIQYTVSPYERETGTVTVDCSFLDSQNVIESYVEKLVTYFLTHLLDGAPTDEIHARLLKEAIDASEEHRVEKTVTITFDPADYSKFTVSDEISDVVSANLRSEIGGMSVDAAKEAAAQTGRQMVSGALDWIFNPAA